ncbi:MAG: hypothetical protein QOH30_740 [Baekduia sp.]|nr:hypothetical protein [Baekduia sp.]
MRSKAGGRGVLRPPTRGCSVLAYLSRQPDIFS